MLEKFLLYTKTVDFIAWVFPVINKFPKSQKFVLGQQIENMALRFLEKIIRANHQKEKAERQKILVELDIDLQVLQALLRVAYLLHFLSSAQLEFALEKTKELGKMLGGWMKQTVSV